MDESTRAQGNTTRQPDEGRLVGTLGTVLVGIYLVTFALALIFFVVYFWPSNHRPEPRELDLLWVVAASGGLGSMVHALRSFYWYVGNGRLVWRWLAMYVLLPFVGATLGLVFYLVIRGGFFAPEAKAETTSPYGFAALAALVGLFSPQAVMKLKQIAEQVLAKAEKGKNQAPEDTDK